MVPQAMLNRRQRGLTLVELIIAMVIISGALAGVLGALSRSAVISADPLVGKQLRAIAEGVMEEIQLKPFSAPVATAPSGCARAGLLNAGDYNGFDANVCAADGTAAPALAGYKIHVDVLQGSGAILSSSIPATDAIEIRVTASRGAQQYVLTGWRTNYGK